MKKSVTSISPDNFFSLEGLAFKKRSKGAFFSGNKRWKNAKAIAQTHQSSELNCKVQAAAAIVLCRFRV